MSAAAQINANRENAQKSIGPTTEQGKARSAHNAVKTGLTGQTVLLPADDVAAYTVHIARLEKQFNPATDEESYLVQSIADAEWRLLRIPALDAGIRALGRLEFAVLFAEQNDPATRAAFIEAKVQLVYKKDLSNLALQEIRLRRHCHVDTGKLQALQAARKQAEESEKDISIAVDLLLSAHNAGKVFVPKLFGFEFSVEELWHSYDLDEFKRNMVGQSATLSKARYETAFRQFVGEGQIAV